MNQICFSQQENLFWREIAGHKKVKILIKRKQLETNYFFTVVYSM
jgi:hypothetical protein